MNVETEHLMDELNQATQTDESVEQTDDTVETGNLNDEQGVEPLDNIEEKKESDRNAVADAQIRKAETMLANGEDIPKSMQWTLQYAKVNTVAETVKPTADLKQELKEELLEITKDEASYEAQLMQLKQVGLSKADQAKVVSKFQDYRNRNFSKGEALKEAMDFHRVSSTSTAANRAGTKLPTPGAAPKGEKNVEDMTADEFLKWSDSQG